MTPPILHSRILHFSSPFHSAEHLADALGEEPRPVQGLGEGVAVAPHLHQEGAGGELLVVAAAAQGDGPGQAHVVGDELLLEADSQGQVVGPARVAGPAAVGAHHTSMTWATFFPFSWEISL